MPTGKKATLDFEIVDPSEIPPGRQRADALSPASLALLEGKRIFMKGPNRAQRFGPMAKARGFRVRTRVGERGGDKGTFIWLESREAEVAPGH